jgi:hypothetical protein
MLGGSRCKAGPTLELAADHQTAVRHQQPTRDSPTFPASQLMPVPVPVPEPTIICTVLYCIECRRASAVGQITMFESAGLGSGYPVGVWRWTLLKEAIPGFLFVLAA